MNDPFPDRLVFAEPAVFWMLTIALPLIFLKIATDRRATQAVRRFTSQSLRRKLVPRSRLYSWLVFGLRVLGLSLFIVALARPQKGEITEEVESVGRSLILAIDTSKSMLARDLKPDRLSRAKLAAQDLVEGLGGDRIGLIAFAGSPYLQAPLTIDHGAVIDFLGQLDTDSAPRGGSNLAKAIGLALETFDKDEGGSHALIVFTDGDELEGSATEVARQAKEKGVVIITIGTGTRLGEIIPDPDPEKRGEFIKDESGKIVRSQLHPESLKEVARITEGIYIDLGATALSADSIEETLEQIETRTFEATEETRRLERYKIPLAAGMICFLASFLLRLFAPSRQASVVARAAASGFARASILAIVALITGLAAGPSFAETDLPEDPKALFEAGQFAEATEAYLQLAEKVAESNNENAGKGQLSGIISKWFRKRPSTDPSEAAQWRYGMGASAFRAKDFETAQRAFSDALQDGDEANRSRAHHGLAGTLFRRGESIREAEKEKAIALWKEALEHYDETIKLDPENQVAPRNAAYIRHLLEEKENQPQPSESKEEPEKGEGENEDDPSEKKEEPGEEGANNEEKKEGDPEANGDPQGEEGEGEPDKNEGQGNEGEPEEGEEKEGDPEGMKEEQTPAEAALEAARRYADEDRGVNFKPKAFRSRGFKDW